MKRNGTGVTEPLEREPLGAERPLSLVVGDGREARRLRIATRPRTVGSAADNDLVLADRTVSGQHCRLERQGADVVVEDLNSRNGTWLDGVQITRARACAGSRIRVGRTDLLLVAPGACESAAPGDGLVAVSPAMVRVVEEVGSYARLRWPVLVQGESGAGKEGIARALHGRGPRSQGPFVALNAGGLARELVESELFGHERGAFTGAVATHRGAFEQADGGTLFLDEIGELPLELQARLLRVLETWEVRRVGSESSVAVDVRLVCATHRDLRKLVHAETFREDLYYRLARLVVTVPPLRERPEDVEALADHFLREIENDVGKKVLSREARDRLLVYPWPGNARELRNVLSAAAASSPSGRIEWADIGRAMDRVAGPHCESRQGSTPHAALHQVLEQHRGNVSAAARTLGMPRSTLRDRLRGLARTGPPAGAPEDRASGEGG